MKLHLPKRLFTALLAAISFIAPAALTLGSTAWGADGWEYKNSWYTYNIGTPGDAMHQTIDATTSFTYSNTTYTPGDTYRIWSDNASDSSVAQNLTVNTLLMKNNDSVTITTGDWGNKKAFNAMTIESLQVADSGKAKVTIGGNNTVNINAVTGTLSSVTNNGTLTLGTENSTINLSGTITNTGTMTLNGNISLDSAIKGAGSVTVTGALTLTDYNNLYNLSCTYADGATSGFRTGFTGSLTEDGTLTFADGATLAISNLGTGDSYSLGDNGTVTGTLVGSTIYDVNENMTYAADTHGSASHVYVNSGFTLTIGNTGNAAGTASGVPASQNFVLNGGSIKWAAQATTIAGIEVIADSDFTIFDMKEVTDSQSIENYLTLGSVDIAAGKTLTINKTNNASWKQWLNIAALTGEGTLNVNGPGSTEYGESNAAYHLITLSDFKGNISVTSREGTNTNNPDRDDYHATINTGESGVNMGTLTIAGFGQDNEQSTFTFNVQGDSSLQSIALTDAATVNVSENKGLTVSTLTGTGTLTKTGSGSMAAGINALQGLLKIEGGSFNLSALADSGDSNNAVYRTVEVGNGATLDINGFAAYNNLTLKEGATLANSSSTAPGSDKRQLPLITLEGNAEVAATGTIRMIGNGYNATTLNLGEYTLTKTGAGEFNMLNTTVEGTGSIQINEGKVVAGVSDGKSQDLSALSLNIQSSGRFELNGSSQSIKSLTMTGGSLATASGHTLTVSDDSTFSSGASTVGGSIIFGGAMEIAEGATAAFNGAMTIAEGATATIGGGATISSTVSNSGTLALNGTLNVTDSSILTQVGEESTSYVGGSVEGNGYTTTTYQLVSGSGSISYGESFAVTLNGATTGIHGTSKGENTLTIDKAGSTFYVMTGEETVLQNEMSFISAYHVAEGATLELANAIANQNGYSTTITGDGKLHINIGSNTGGTHGNVLKSASGFTGVVEIESTGTNGAGNTQLNAYVLGDGASFRLISGNHWSNGTPQVIDRDIELAGETVDSFTFRHANGVRLSGKVTGTYLTAGQKYNSSSDANNMFLSGAGSKIQHVTMKCNGAAAGKLTVEANMAFGTLFANEVVLTNPATLDIGYTDDSGEVISGDSSINGLFTLNANTGLNITAGTMNVNGAVTNSGAITVSGGSVDFANTLGMGAGSSLIVSGGSATVSGALNVTGENVSLSQSDTGVLNLTDSVTIAEGSNATLAGSMGLGATIVNNGTLALNGSTFELLNDLATGKYTVKSEGNAGYTQGGSNGFYNANGAEYYLTYGGALAEGTDAELITVKNGDTTYNVGIDDAGQVYFGTSNAVGTTFYISDGEVTVTSSDAARAQAYELSAGTTMTLSEAAATNAGVTINAAGTSTINLAAGSTLNAFTKEGSGSITLTGSGTYDLGSGITTLDSGISLASSWTGTVTLSAIPAAAGLNMNSFGNAGSKVKLDGISGWFARAKFNPHIVLGDNGLTFTDYSIDMAYNFANGISGNGNFVVSAKANTVTATPFIAIGSNSDTSLKWSGKFKVDNVYGSVTLLLNGGGTYFDAESATAGIEMNDADNTLSLYVGYATASNETSKNISDYVTTGDTLTTINGAISNNSTGNLELTVLNDTVFNKEVAVTSMTVNSGKTATMNATLEAGSVTNSGELKLADKATISGGTMSNVQMSSEGIASSATDGSEGSISSANVEIAQLAEDASFTIQDMTLTNTTITAATPTTQVNFSNVTVAGATVLRNMQASMTGANVAAGGSEGVKGVFTASTSLLSGITLANTDAVGSTIVVDLGDLSCAAPMGPGKYDLSITLSGFTMQDCTQGIVFAADSWLGQLLTAQGATAYVSGAVETPASVSEGGSTGGVSVSYSAVTGGNVGTVITITGLNVPEPATSTLSLLALAALAARRRRK